MIREIDPVPLWRLEVTVPQHAVVAFETALEGICGAVTSFGDDDTPWRVEGYTDTEPDETSVHLGLTTAAEAVGIDTPKLEIEFLTPRDWLAENLISFSPLRIGRFFIYPSHFEDTLPPGLLPIRIDPGTAFGSGEHPTTGTCLTVLSDLAKSHACTRILDLGCGSGILSFAATKLWRGHVTSVDIDTEAVRVTRMYANINRLGNRITTLVSRGYQNPRVRDRAPYDLIVANVLARPLMAMAADTASALRSGGLVVLSGLLERDATKVALRHRAHGLVLRNTVVQNDWATLVMRKQGRR